MGDEHELPPDAIVIRGGSMEPALLVDAADRALLTIGVHGISVFAADSPSVGVDELIAESVIAHSSVRLSTVERIRAAGFVIRRAGRYPHCTVELDPSAPFEAGQRLASVFDPPIRNPRPGRT